MGLEFIIYMSNKQKPIISTDIQHYTSYKGYKITAKILLCIILLKTENPKLTGFFFLCYVQQRFGVEITREWYNNIFRRFGTERNGKGRPRKADKISVENYFKTTCETEKKNSIVCEEVLEAILDKYNFNDIVKEALEKESMPKQEISSFLNHILDIIKASVFGETGHLSDIDENTSLSYDYTYRSTIGILSKLYSYPETCQRVFEVMRERLCFLNEMSSILLYFDGHVKPFYTHKPSFAGKISATDKLMMGTKQVFCNTHEGYILGFKSIRVNNHMGNTVLKELKLLKNDLPQEDGSIKAIADAECRGKQLHKDVALETGISFITGGIVYENKLDEYELMEECPLGKILYNEEEDRYLYFYDLDGKKFGLYVSQNDFLSMKDVLTTYRRHWEAQEYGFKDLIKHFNWQVNYGRKMYKDTDTKLIDRKKELEEGIDKIGLELYAKKLSKDKEEKLIKSGGKKWNKLIKLRKQKEQKYDWNVTVNDTVSSLKILLFNILSFMLIGICKNVSGICIEDIEGLTNAGCFKENVLMRPCEVEYLDGKKLVKLKLSKKPYLQNRVQIWINGLNSLRLKDKNQRDIIFSVIEDSS